MQSPPADEPIALVPLQVDLTEPAPSVLDRKLLFINFISLVVSSVVHLLIIWLFLVVYMELAEKKPGSGFFVGRGGDAGQPLEISKIDGLEQDLSLEQAIVPQMAPTDGVDVRPVESPAIALRPASSLPDLSGALKMPDAKPSLENLVARQWSAAAVSSRSPGMKTALLKSEGGTAESEKAVARGLEWLAGHQNDDGSWSLSPGKKCGHSECGQMQVESLEAATGLALLPFLAAGHTPGQPGPYQKTLEKGLKWLQEHVDKQGRVMPDNAPTHYHMYAHAIVTITLCEATAMNPAGAWAAAAQRAAQYIVNAQNRQDGGWRYFPGQAGDTSVYGWQVMALRSARVAGMNVPKTTMTLTRRWLTKAAASRDGSAYAYQPMRPASPVMTTEALLCRQLMGDGPRERGMAKGTQLVMEDLERTLGRRNYYYWYYATQLMHNTGGKAWSRWNPTIREKLIGEQRVGPNAGHASGCWQPLEPAPDQWGRAAGPIMQTALGLLTLEVYYRHLPLYQVDLPKEAAATK